MTRKFILASIHNISGYRFENGHRSAFRQWPSERGGGPLPETSQSHPEGRSPCAVTAGRACRPAAPAGTGASCTCGRRPGAPPRSTYTPSAGQCTPAVAAVASVIKHQSMHNKQRAKARCLIVQIVKSTGGWGIQHQLACWRGINENYKQKPHHINFAG